MNCEKNTKREHKIRLACKWSSSWSYTKTITTYLSIIRCSSLCSDINTFSVSVTYSERFTMALGFLADVIKAKLYYTRINTALTYRICSQDCEKCKNETINTDITKNINAIEKIVGTR